MEPKKRNAAPLVALGAVAVLALLAIAGLVLVPSGGDDASPTATVQVSGSAEVCDENGECQPLEDGDEVEVSATVRTGDDGEVALQFPDGSVVRVEPDSEVDVDAIDEGRVALELLAGSVAFEASADAAVVVQTSAGTASAGDADGLVDCSSGPECSFTAARNQIDVELAGETTVVEAGDMVTFPTGGEDIDRRTGGEEAVGEDAADIDGNYELTIGDNVSGLVAATLVISCESEVRCSLLLALGEGATTQTVTEFGTRDGNVVTMESDTQGNCTRANRTVLTFAADGSVTGTVEECSGGDFRSVDVTGERIPD